MQIRLEQIFYGRGERGYAILGNSPDAANLSAHVDFLCGAVGTPNNDYRGEPFLLSVPEKDSVIMICGRRGVPDSMGRETLFFHALVADKAAMSAVKADAASLFRQGVFVDKMPSGGIATLCVDVDSNASRRSGGNVNVTAPCVIRAEKPLLDVVRAAVGHKALDLSWATFAFQPMQSFDVQVLPLRAPCPRTVNEYDATGKLMRCASKADSSRREEAVQRHPDEAAWSSGRQIANVSPEDKSNVMFRLSVVLNVALAVVCVLLLSSRKTTTDKPIGSAAPIVVTNTVEKIVEKRVPVQLSDAQRVEIEDAAIERFCSELKNGFPMEKEILDFDASVTKLPKYEYISTDPKFGQQKAFLDNLKFYVDFVNKNLLKGKTQ